MSRIALLAACAAVLAAGCGQKPAPAGAPPAQTGPGQTSAPTTPKGGGSQTTVEIDPSLKHDAYQYNGFDRKGPLKYLFARVAGDKPEEGTQETTFKGLTKDGAAYSIARTGALADLSTEDYEVRKDGIYLVSTGMGSPKTPALVMPAKLAPGTVWNYAYDMTESSGTKLSFKGTARAGQVEKVKVPAGQFDALPVTETATLKKADGTSTLSSKSWYVKGLGLVRFKMEVKGARGPVASTIELASTGD